MRQNWTGIKMLLAQSILIQAQYNAITDFFDGKLTEIWIVKYAH